MSYFSGSSGAVARVMVGSAAQLSTFAQAKQYIINSQVFFPHLCLSLATSGLCYWNLCFAALDKNKAAPQLMKFWTVGIGYYREGMFRVSCNASFLNAFASAVLESVILICPCNYGIFWTRIALWEWCFHALSNIWIPNLVELEFMAWCLVNGELIVV